MAAWCSSGWPIAGRPYRQARPSSAARARHNRAFFPALSSVRALCLPRYSRSVRVAGIARSSDSAHEAAARPPSSGTALMCLAVTAACHPRRSRQVRSRHRHRSRWRLLRLAPHGRAIRPVRGHTDDPASTAAIAVHSRRSPWRSSDQNLSVTRTKLRFDCSRRHPRRRSASLVPRQAHGLRATGRPAHQPAASVGAGTHGCPWSWLSLPRMSALGRSADWPLWRSAFGQPMSETGGFQTFRGSGSLDRGPVRIRTCCLAERMFCSGAYVRWGLTGANAT